MILLYIILFFVGLAALIFVGTIVVLVIKQTYQLRTGKLTYAELEAMTANHKSARATKKQKKGSSFHWLGYPSPLNSWGLWN